MPSLTHLPDPSLLEAFPTPADQPFVIEHIADEFTSVCPVTGHPDFGTVTLRFEPRPPKEGGTCVELKSLKMYLQRFRNEGIFYENVTNRIADDLVDVLQPRRLTLVARYSARGGISTNVTVHYEAGQKR